MKKLVSVLLMAGLLSSAYANTLPKVYAASKHHHSPSLGQSNPAASKKAAEAPLMGQKA